MSEDLWYCLLPRKRRAKRHHRIILFHLLSCCTPLAQASACDHDLQVHNDNITRRKSKRTLELEVNVQTGGVVFSTPERKNFLDIEGLQIQGFPGASKEGVQLDWDRAIPSWHLSNENYERN